MKVAQEVLDSFIKADKPEWLNAVDFSVMVVLLQVCIEHTTVWLSYKTLALRAGIGESSARRSAQKLKQKGWISWVSGKRRQKTNTYEMLLHNLPTYQPEKLIVSPEAEGTAQWYYDTFMKYFKVYRNNQGRKCSRARSIKKGWKKRWAVVIQRHIDATSHEEVKKQLAKFANEDLNKQQRGEVKNLRFVRGPQCLPWPKAEKKEVL